MDNATAYPLYSLLIEVTQKCNANCVLETKTSDALEQSKTWLIGHNWA